MMMKIIKSTLLLFLLAVSLISCNKEPDLGESNLDTDTPELTDLDVWIRENFVYPNNIDVLYSWKAGTVDLNAYLYPPKKENIKPVLEVIKKVWINSYNEAANEEFVRRIAPRQLVFIGGLNLNAAGNRVLGVAEGGKRITFFETDLVDLKNRESLKMFLSTMQHEYAHILNQRFPYDREGFQKITPSGYTAQWFNESRRVANELGYVSQYARKNVDEDFAEMVNFMLSNSGERYNKALEKIERRIIEAEIAKATANLPAGTTAVQRRAIVNAVTVVATEKAKQSTGYIRAKESIVVDYYKTNFNIDFYKLQRIMDRNIEEVLKQ